MSASEANTRLTFFFPGARALSKEEATELPEEKKKAVPSGIEEGIWLEIECPDRSCIEKGKITVPVEGAGEGEKGFWLRLFCPEGSCKITEDTELP